MLIKSPTAKQPSMRVVNFALSCAALSFPAVYGNYVEIVNDIHHSITNFFEDSIRNLDTTVQNFDFGVIGGPGAINLLTTRIDAVASAPQVPFMQGLAGLIVLTEEDAESINTHLKNFISSQTGIIFDELKDIKEKIRAVTNDSINIDNIRAHLATTAISQGEYADAFVAIASDLSKQIFIDYKMNVDASYQSAIANYTE